MAAIVKTKSVTAVLSGEAGARPVRELKAEDFIRDSIVATPGISQNDLLKEVGNKFPEYGYSSFKIAYSRYSATMRSVKNLWNLTKKEAKK